MIYTVGHSNVSITDFIVTLRTAKIDLLVDVRSHPTSFLPHFEAAQLERYLNKAGISYVWLKGLGGWDVEHESLIDKFAKVGVDVAAYTSGSFPKQRIARKTKDPKAGWTNQGLYDYQWAMTLPEFHKDASKLVSLGVENRPAIMCAEFLWWKCHRSMIADYLEFFDVPVTHITPKAGRHPLGDRISRYDKRVVSNWRDRSLIQ